jgi:hypothetical protein
MTINNIITMPSLSAKDIIRFWSKVAKWWPKACWEWKARKDKDGYGKFTVSISGRKLHLRAHRVALILTVGQDLAANITRHSCDNPSCCNPAHLKPGTIQDNKRDSVERNRQAKGEKTNKSKLTESAVCQIRDLYAAGNITRIALGERFSVSGVMIGRIIARKNWKHV